MKLNRESLVRGVAVDAERHWWDTQIAAFIEVYGGLAASMPVVADLLARLDAIRLERTR